MNVLFINDLPFNPSLGGIERVTDILCRCLLDRGFNVYYLCGNIADENMFSFDFPVHQYMLPEKNLFESQPNVDYLCNFIDEYKIDIVINQRGLENTFNLALESIREKWGGVRY